MRLLKFGFLATPDNQTYITFRFFLVASPTGKLSNIFLLQSGVVVQNPEKALNIIGLPDTRFEMLVRGK